MNALAQAGEVDQQVLAPGLGPFEDAPVDPRGTGVEAPLRT